MMKQPLFSIVMPVYNVESYLAESIESVVQQKNINFDIELIIVDDGSVDNSLRIAQAYQEQYPEIIRVVTQENSGVSVAKNKGIELARGKYLGFLDSDDLYTSQTLHNAALYFRDLADEVDVIAIPMQFFGSLTIEHRLNTKFNEGNRVIDVSTEWENVQLSAASCFVRKECIEDLGLRFHPKLKLGEDAKFITDAIMRKGRFAVMATAKYMYRKREVKTSAIDTFADNPLSYLSVLQNGWLELFSRYRENFGYIPRYVQNVAAHDMEWRLKQKEQNALNQDELDYYYEELRKVISQIDDEVWVSQKFLGDVHRLYALGIKYDDPGLRKLNVSQGFAKIGEVELWKIKKNQFRFDIDLLDIEDGNLAITGRFTGFEVPNQRYGAFVDGRFIEAEVLEAPKFMEVTNNGRRVFVPTYLSLQIPVLPGKRIEFGTIIDGEEFSGVKLNYGFNTRIAKYARSYRKIGSYLLVNASNQALYVKNYSAFNNVKSELMHVRRMAYAMLKSKTLSKTVPFMRIAAFMAKKLKRRELWLVTDRLTNAGDNGEALFKYLHQHPVKNVDIKFVLRKDSTDFSRIKQFGEVVDPRSFQGKMAYLTADKLISSQADAPVLQPFGGQYDGYCDLLAYDFTFLQHGITKDDLSSWLHKTRRNIKCFVTASHMEYESIANENYGYTNGEVVLTGFPRFDNLERGQTEKVVAFAPTWRLGLAMPIDAKTGVRGYNPDFVESDYFQFIQSILSNEDLMKTLKTNGYKLKLYLHPNHQANIVDFAAGGEEVELVSAPFDYSELFAKASLMITDYSSVAFDFAYLRKPIIYSQFDEAQFFAGHSYQKGYFSYQEDGFGPVTRTAAETVAAIIAAIESGCRISEEYLQRVNQFFAFEDQNNSERVVNAILAAR